MKYENETCCFFETINASQTCNYKAWKPTLLDILSFVEWYCSHFFITRYPGEIAIFWWASNMAATRL